MVNRHGTATVSCVLALLILSLFANVIGHATLGTAAPLLKGELVMPAAKFGVLFSASWTYSALLFAGG